jgi:hypothetical protein
LQIPGAGCRPGQSNGDARSGERQSPAQDQPHHLPPLGAQGDPDADFAGALHHRVNQHAVDANPRKQARDDGEHPDQHGVEALPSHGIRHQGFHRLNGVDAGVEIRGSHCPAHPWNQVA